jgi:MinD superfamily P-loop ATPase
MTIRSAQPILPQIDLVRCTGCGICERLCPTKAVVVRANLATIVRPQTCTYCDLCETAPKEQLGGRSRLCLRQKHKRRLRCHAYE